MAVTSWTSQFESQSSNEWSQGSQAGPRGGSVSYKSSSPAAATNQGTYYGWAYQPSGSGTSYVRWVKDDVTFTESESIWFGCHIYLPSGFYSAQNAQVRIGPQIDNFGTVSSGMSRLGFWINTNDDCFMFRSVDSSVTPNEQTTLIALGSQWVPEGEWTQIEFGFVLHRTNGSAYTAAYKNGTFAGSTTTANVTSLYSPVFPFTRFRGGINDASSVTNAISAGFDAFYIDTARRSATTSTTSPSVGVSRYPIVVGSSSVSAWSVASGTDTTNGSSYTFSVSTTPLATPGKLVLAVHSTNNNDSTAPPKPSVSGVASSWTTASSVEMGSAATISTPSLVASVSTAAASGTGFATSTATWNSGYLYLLGVTERRADSTNSVSPTISGAGAWSLVEDAVYDVTGTSRRTLWVYQCIPSSTTSAAVSITFTDAVSGVIAHAVEIASGFNTGAPRAQTVAASGTSDTQSSFSTAAVSAGSIGVLFSALTFFQDIYPQSPYTELEFNGLSSGGPALSSSYATSSFSTPSASWLSPGEWGGVWIEVAKSATSVTQQRLDVFEAAGTDATSGPVTLTYSSSIGGVNYSLVGASSAQSTASPQNPMNTSTSSTTGIVTFATFAGPQNAALVFAAHSTSEGTASSCFTELADTFASSSGLQSQWYQGQSDIGWASWSTASNWALAGYEFVQEETTSASEDPPDTTPSTSSSLSLYQLASASLTFTRLPEG